ncbi:MAG: hypothetical protein K0S54_3117 [Alphaproteobacteria bacterium]|nr:hypothetical protein [Alphaproteobacteria bacterium]
MALVFRAILPLLLLVLGWPAAAQDVQPWRKDGANNFPYVYRVLPAEEPEVWRTNVVPLWPNEVCFGWTLDVKGADRMVDLTEILTLSSPSTNWGHGPETIIENGNKATTKLKVRIESNRLSRAWCIVEGDPPGQYRYDIFIDGRHRAEFTYCAVKVPNDGSVRIEELTCPYKFDSVRNRELHLAEPIDLASVTAR